MPICHLPPSPCAHKCTLRQMNTSRLGEGMRQSHYCKSPVHSEHPSLICSLLKTHRRKVAVAAFTAQAIRGDATLIRTRRCRLSENARSNLRRARPSSLPLIQLQYANIILRNRSSRSLQFQLPVCWFCHPLVLFQTLSLI